MFNELVSTAALAILVAGCTDYGPPTGIKPSSTPDVIAIVSGDAQTATVTRALTNPLVARVSDAHGRPVRNATVWFEVLAGDGAIIGRASIFTDSVGSASAVWRLGQSTAGDQTARARVVQSAANARPLDVTFHATALPDVPLRVDFARTSGEPLESAPSFTRSVVARAFDVFRNPVPGAVVRWTAPMAGTLDAETTVTSADGSTENQWTVRAASGQMLVGGYWITASIENAGSAAPPALFTQTVGDDRLAAASLAAGEAHGCAVVVEPAETYCWGENSSGQRGDGTRSSQPFAVRVATAESFTQVVAGMMHTCALAKSGKPYCWGANGDGQLGDGTRVVADRPVAVLGSETFVSLTAGRWHTCGLTDAGAAYCWGANTAGQLGDSTTASHSVPTAVAGGAEFASITAGGTHTCGLTRDGATLCWGSDEAGQLGVVFRETECLVRCLTSPTPVEGRFVGLVTGLQYTCGLEADGIASCWGGYLADRVKVGEIRFTDLVGGGADSACGITPEGRAYCWTFSYDYDYYYYYDEPSVSEPQLVAGGRAFSALELGDTQTCGLERDTAPWVVCWSGRNAPGFVVRVGRP